MSNTSVTLSRLWKVVGDAEQRLDEAVDNAHPHTEYAEGYQDGTGAIVEAIRDALSREQQAPDAQ